jgi:uncharacterized protein
MHSKEKINAMLEAINSSDYIKMDSLLAESQDFLDFKFVLGSWLHVAAKKNNIGVAKYLLDKGIDINNKCGSFDANALNHAASHSQYEIAKFLLKNGSQMDTSEPERNPLFGAIYVGNYPIAKLLIDNGIDISIKYTGERMKNMDALVYAEERGELEIAELIRAELAKQKLKKG